MKRTFLAIEISPGNKLLSVYNHFKGILQNEKIRWVNPDHFHITMFFLGETREDQIPLIISEIEQSINGANIFNLNIKGCGVFPAVVNPAVLWLGIEKSNELVKLKISIDETLKSFGFKAEKRKFTPHLTIARIKEIKDRSKLIENIGKFESESVGQVRIDKLVYFESMLTPNGPAYNKLSEFHFL